MISSDTCPFVHKFEGVHGQFIYDVNTNHLLTANPGEYDLIDDFGVLTHEEIAAKWAHRYDRDTIMRTLSEFVRMQENGFLSPEHPESLGHPIPEEELADSLDGSVEQLILNTTEQCNLRCRYCLFSASSDLERSHTSRHMSCETALRAIDFYHRHSRRGDTAHIAFYGGEPLSCFETIRTVIDYALTLEGWPNLTLHIDTNGILLTEAMSRFFIVNEVFLQISLDGPRECHDRYRVFPNGDGSFTRLEENLHRLRNLDPAYFESHVSFSTTLTPPFDLDQIDQFFSTEMFGRNVLSVNAVNGHDSDFFTKYTGDRPNRLLETLLPIQENYIAARCVDRIPSPFSQALHDKPLADLVLRGMGKLNCPPYPNGICAPGVRRVFVSVDGDLFPCERAAGADFQIGDLESGLDVQKVRNLIDTYREVSASDCLDCWAVRLCQLCFASMKRGDRFDLDRKRLWCIQQRQGLEDQLVLYTRLLDKNPDSLDFVHEMIFDE